MCAWIYVSESKNTTEPEKREIAPHQTTYTPTELENDVVSNFFHCLTLSKFWVGM